MDNKDIKEVLLKERGINVEIIGKNDTFDFKCDKCGKCCTKNTIETILFKPYDIYKLAKGLNKNPLELAMKHGDIYIGEGSGFPIVRMEWKMSITGNGIEIVCPFRESLPDGKNICGVHGFKPGSCKLFPLGRISAYDESKKDKAELIYFVQEVSCGEKGELHTIEDWVGNTDYDAKVLHFESDSMRTINDIVSLPDLRNLAQKFPSIRKTADAYYNALFATYYTNFDLSDDADDFLDQAKANLRSIILSTKALAYTLITSAYDEEVIRYIKNNVVSKTFETDHAKFIIKMNKAHEEFERLQNN